MNQNFGLIGKKLGNMQVFNDDGTVARVTAIQVGPCTVLGKRTPEQHGYSALLLGFGERREKIVNKPEAGLFKKLGRPAARKLQEFRLPADVVAKYEVGQVIKPSEAFAVGQKVDVCGQTRGRGFQGVMYRWGFKGSKASHGAHEYKRHGGAVGTNMTPGRTFPNHKMPGQYGNERITIQNLVVARIHDAEQIVLIEGAVPGPKGAVVTVRGAIKAKRTAAA